MMEFLHGHGDVTVGVLMMMVLAEREMYLSPGTVVPPGTVIAFGSFDTHTAIRIHRVGWPF